MHVKSNIIHVLLFSIILLVPANSLILYPANAQGQSYDDVYQENYSYDYDDQYDSYYYFSSNATKVQEREVYFLKETYKQLSDKQRDFIFDTIESEFGSLDRLCTLIVNERITEQELEKILRHILIQIFNKKIGNGYQNDNYNKKNEKVYSYTLEDDNRYYNNQYDDIKYYLNDNLEYYDDNNYYKLTYSNLKIDELIVEILNCVFPPLTVTKNWFACDNTTLDCTVNTFNKQSIEPTFDGSGSDSYIQCTSEEECPINPSDSNFKIKIDGNNPNHSSINALIGTESVNIDIENGPYYVSEILKGQQEQFMPKFDRLFVGNFPQGVAYAQDKMLMYVTNSNDDTVTILDTAGGTDNTVGNADDIVGTVAVGNFPQGVAFKTIDEV